MALPPGLILNPQTGEVAGTPTQVGSFDVQLRVRDALGVQRVIDENIVINPYTQMQFVGGYAPMMRTRAYSSTPNLTGGLEAIAFTHAGGVLPAGLSLNPVTGALTGTPSATGPTGFTVRATDALTQTEDLVTVGAVAENLTLTYAASVDITIGVPFTGAVPVRTGGTTPVTFSLASGALPPGLSLNAATGQITGTPTTAGAYAGIVLRATDANGFTANSAASDFEVFNVPVLSGALGRGTVGRPWYGGSLAVTGGKPAIAWTATGLPAGLSVHPSTGVVSGVPSAAATTTTTVRATDALGAFDEHIQQITIAAALTLTGAVPAAVRGVAYSFTPTAAGGWGPYAFSLASGALPAGLTLNAQTGAITGTPTTQQAANAVLRVTDMDGTQADLAVNITVAGDLSLTGSTPDKGTTTVAYNGTTYAATGGLAPLAWSISAGALPAGLSLNTSTGAITGTPTTPGAYSFTVRVQDANSSSVQASATITVAAFPSLSGVLPDASNGVAYDQGLTLAGGHAPIAWSVSVGALPTGLTINASTGRITGTPSANGTFNFTIRAQDAQGNVVTRAQTIVTYAQPQLSGSYATETEAALSGGGDGTAYSSTITLTGGKPAIAWSLAGTLPPGLSFNNGTGQISGTTQYVSGTAPYTDYAFTVTVTDALGRQASSNQSIRLYRHVLRTPDAPYPAATQGVAYSQQRTGVYGKAGYTSSVISGALPAGLTLAANGTLSGTPSGSGTSNFTVRITDALGKTTDASQPMTVYAAVDISGAAPSGTAGIGYSHTYGRSGGDGAYSFSLVAGALPPGLSLNSSTGVVSGTINASGSLGAYNFTVRVTSAGSIDDQASSMTVYSFPTLVIDGVGRGTVSRAYSGQLSVGGVPATPLTFAVQSGSIPPGLSLNSSTGAITGTPTTAGNYSAVYRVTDALGNVDTKSVSIAVAAYPSINGSYASPVVEDAAYSSQVTGSGGWTPYSFSVVSGAPPTGTTLAANGVLSGTPTTPGTYAFTVRLTDADGATVDKAMSVTISAATPALSVSASPNPCNVKAVTTGNTVNAVASSTVTVTGGTGNNSFSWVRLNSFVFAGIGTPSSSGTTTNTLQLSKTGSSDYQCQQDWRCTVDDGVSSVSVTVEFFVEIDNLNQDPT